MLNALGLGFVFKAKDEVSHVAHQVHGNLEKLHEAGEKSHGSTIKAMATHGLAIAAIGTAIAVGVGAGAFEFAEHAERFSSAIRRAGVAAHATGEELEAFEHMAKSKAMDSLKGSAIETAETLEQLAKEGYSLEEAGQAVNGTLDLMRISMGALSPSSAAGLVNDTLGQFGMKADQAGELADKLAFSMRNFGFRAEELQGTMSGLAAGAYLVGASLDDTLIGVGLIKQVFPSATKSAQAMNVAMQQLASTHTQKELAGIGLAVKDNHGKMKPLLQIMSELSSKTAKMTDAQLAHKLATIGSARAAGGLSIIIDALRKGVKDESGHLLTGAAALEHYRKQMANAEGTAKKMAAILGDDMGGAIKALKGALSNAGVAFGSLFEGKFKGAIQTVNLLVRGLTQLFTQGGFSGEVKDALDKNLPIKDFAIKIFLWVERIKNFFSNLGDSFMRAFEPFKPMLDLLLQSFGFLGQALGLTGQTADDNTSKWESFGQAGAHVGEVLANLAGAAIPVVMSVVLALAGAVEVVKEAWKRVGPVFTEVWGTVSGVVRAISGLFSGNWKMAWDGFIDVVVNAALSVLRVVVGMVGGLTKVLDKVVGVFGIKLDSTGAIEQFKEGLKFAAPAMKALVPGEPSPAKAAIEGQAKAHGAGAPAGGGGGPEVTHNHTTVVLDGDKIAEALHTRRREAKSLSFQDAPAGGF